MYELGRTLMRCKIKKTNEEPRDKSLAQNFIEQLVLDVYGYWRSIYVLDPDSLTLRVRITTGSTVVCTVLFVLGSLREVIDRVAHIPNLVDTAIAIPNLSLDNINAINTRGRTTGAYRSAICFISTRKINALVVISPNQTVIHLSFIRNRILCMH